MPSDQYTMQDPTKRYPGPSKKMAEEQPGPGLQREMPITPDAGERTYRGAGRLTGRKAIVTGADSGIGRSRLRLPARGPTSCSRTCPKKRPTPAR